MAALILIVMLFLHVYADYSLQGILADMKQRSWWIEKLGIKYAKEPENSMYSKDYLVALITHAFEWTFVVMIPMLYFCVKNSCEMPMIIVYVVLLVSETGVHAEIDNDKANNKILSLAGDQFLHIVQVFFIWFIWLISFGY